MWKSDDEESNLLVVDWASPPAPPVCSPMSVKINERLITTNSSAIGGPMPPLPPPSPFSELFSQELLQSSGLLLNQFDDDVNCSEDHGADVSRENDESCFAQPADGQQIAEDRTEQSSLQPATAITSGFYRCAECRFSTDDRRLFMCHKRSKHAGEKTFSCPDCSAKFTRQYSLKKHVLQKHPAACTSVSTQVLKYCSYPNCKFATKNPISMQLHKRSHQQLYFCKECNARYTRRQSLLGHLTKQHGSNAALIGMGPSPSLANGVDDRHLRSPPSQVSTAATADTSFFQHTDAVPKDRENVTVRHEEERESATAAPITAFQPGETGHSSTVGNGTCSTQFGSAHTASVSTSSGVSGTVVAEDSVNSEEPADGKFFCDKCHFMTTSLRRLYGHKLSSHRSAKEKKIVKASHHICPHCPRKFASLKRMLTHVKKIHSISIKKQRSKASGGGAKQRRQPARRRPPPVSMICDRCDFRTSRKRVFAAHMKSHTMEDDERVQDSKLDNQIRKSNQTSSKRITPDRPCGDFTSCSTRPNTPTYTTALSPRDFYFNGTCASSLHGGSGSSTHSNGSVVETAVGAYRHFGQFSVAKKNCGNSSANSSSSDSCVANNRSIRLDLTNQSSSGLDEISTCLQGLQQANSALLQLVRRRENELRSLRSNVAELLRLLLPNNQAFQGVLTLDNVDDVVTNTLSRVLSDAALQSEDINLVVNLLRK